ncbi:c-type cytochrome [Afifella pfennigii]|uniref:c-type cytochrome n=1 Tax=Afifella pfennigii TaxID=209897 RepID=UPI00047A9287|nr:cytochrome c [Afifella pfennigii]
MSALTKTLGVAAVSAAVAGAAIWWLTGTDSQAVVLRPNDPQTVAAGAAIYARECASCHGANLQGEPNWQSRGPDGLLPAPPHDETGHTWHHPDELLFRLTKEGVAEVAGLEGYKTNMPAYEARLSDEEIVAALSYIKAQWPPEVRRRHDEMNRRAGGGR